MGVLSQVISEVVSLQIWIDALILDREAAGIGQYVRALFEAYRACYPDDVMHGFFQPHVAIEGVELVTVDQVQRSGRRLWYEQVVLPGLLRRLKYDVVHFPDYQVPLLRPVRRTVMTVHDLAAFRLPEVFLRQKAQTKRFLMRRSVQKAQRIIVPSQATRDDLMEILRVPQEKITVVPHGVKRRGVPMHERQHPRPYFLAVGTVEPRKNFAGLIRAYHLLSQRKRDIPDLVIAGRLGWLYQETLELPEKLGVAERVKFLQYVSEDTLATLYRDTIAMVYPSFYEGFGLPVIEAMQAGIPVITSRGGALGELGGEDSLWRVDPYDVASIADTMEAVLDGGDVVRERADSARQWAEQLTWERAAMSTRKVYEEVAQGG